MNSFKDLGLLPEIVQAVEELGYETPTPIQAQAIPALLEGNTDLVGLAQTGTGKTAAFGLPLLQRLDPSLRSVQALVLSPTRELCMQICRELEGYSKYLSGVSVVPVYGGADIRGQMRAISRGAQVVVATPGRLIDLIERGALDLSIIQTLVLDEADEMLNMGFQEDIDHILSHTPEDKSTWLFSATMPREVREISSRYMESPMELSAGTVNTSAENIRHIYYAVPAKYRYEALKRIVDIHPDIFGIVFCRTKLETQEVAEKLIRDGYNADALHGDLSQQQRDKVMGRFRERSLQVLVATDVAARGIDVSNVTHVIHYNLPDDIENYTHRSGRTARAGKSGVSIALIHTREVGRIRQLERQLNRKFLRELLPTGIEVCEAQLFGMVNKMKAVEVREEQMETYLPRIMEALEGLSKEEVITRFAALEFNRFLDYYKNAPDLNPSETTRHDGPGERYITGTPMFINVGKMDDMDRGSLVKLIASTANIPGAKIGRITMKGVYSFFELDPSVVNNVMEAFRNFKVRGRRIRVDVEEGKGGGGGQGGHGGHSGEKKPRPQFDENAGAQQSQEDKPRTYGGYFTKREQEGKPYGKKAEKSEKTEGQQPYWKKVFRENGGEENTEARKESGTTPGKKPLYRAKEEGTKEQTPAGGGFKGKKPGFSQKKKEDGQGGKPFGKPKPGGKFASKDKGKPKRWK